MSICLFLHRCTEGCAQSFAFVNGSRWESVQMTEFGLVARRSRTSRRTGLGGEMSWRSIKWRLTCGYGSASLGHLVVDFLLPFRIPFGGSNVAALWCKSCIQLALVQSWGTGQIYVRFGTPSTPGCVTGSSQFPLPPPCGLQVVDLRGVFQVVQHVQVWGDLFAGSLLGVPNLGKGRNSLTKTTHSRPPPPTIPSL